MSAHQHLSLYVATRHLHITTRRLHYTSRTVTARPAYGWQACCGGVAVGEVDAGSQAAAQRVPVGGMVVALNGVAVPHVSPEELTRSIQEASRPLVLLVRHPDSLTKAHRSACQPPPRAAPEAVGTTECAAADCAQAAIVVQAPGALAANMQCERSGGDGGGGGRARGQGPGACSMAISDAATTHTCERSDEFIATAEAMAQEGAEVAPPGGVSDGGASDLS